MFIARRSIYKKYLQMFSKKCSPFCGLSVAISGACLGLCVANFSGPLYGHLANLCGHSGPLYGLLANLSAGLGRSQRIFGPLARHNLEREIVHHVNKKCTTRMH